jgi:hypothetical protein
LLFKNKLISRVGSWARGKNIYLGFVLERLYTVMNESEFDKLVVYTLRVELLDGKILLYRIDAVDKQNLMQGLSYAGSDEKRPLKFLLFETYPERQVVINVDSIARVTFCYDPVHGLATPGDKYHDNFDAVHKETSLENMPVEGDEERMHVVQEEYIPDGIIYHKGTCPKGDHFYTNPMLYSSLDDGELAGLDAELNGEEPLRQFINLTDVDGEESFIPMNQIVVMEVASEVFG